MLFFSLSLTNYSILFFFLMMMRKSCLKTKEKNYFSTSFHWNEWDFCFFSDLLFSIYINHFLIVNRQYDKKNAKNPHLEIDDDHDLKMNQISWFLNQRKKIRLFMMMFNYFIFLEKGYRFESLNCFVLIKHTIVSVIILKMIWFDLIRQKNKMKKFLIISVS